MKDRKAHAEITIDFCVASDAEAIRRALTPETSVLRTTRASAKITRRGRTMRMKLYARDLVALRAIVNSFLRFAATWKRVCETMDAHRKRARARREGRRVNGDGPRRIEDL